MFLYVFSTTTKNIRIIVAISDHLVARETEKSTDLLSRMIMIDKKPPSFRGFIADRAATTLGKYHCVIL